MTKIFLDIHNERFEAVEVFGIPALFTTERITRSTIPKELYAYDMQEMAGDCLTPGLLAPHVTDEHFGTVLTATPIELPDDDSRKMEESDFIWPSSSDRPTVAEFAEQRGITLSPARVIVENPTRRPAR